eukprot:CAMPEP_0206494992 /NCGR_PEP_ID=MMETSP0324_2-20121206/48132_1 /ASSEMBLY_ACC=CAM_ASM_000836 /TAXON_ID=2866 /ORGANISM="Crypthecodinium cohnii, Strain Seligo" /LENGTH=82 /DNA_ID=CAMNT_0053978901 /DNA_START=54 /DNA_END=298 /DNA_ORIENTATION=-
MSNRSVQRPLPSSSQFLGDGGALCISEMRWQSCNSITPQRQASPEAWSHQIPMGMRPYHEPLVELGKPRKLLSAHSRPFGNT